MLVSAPAKGVRLSPLAAPTQLRSQPPRRQPDKHSALAGRRRRRRRLQLRWAAVASAVDSSIVLAPFKEMKGSVSCAVLHWLGPGFRFCI